MNAMHDYVIRMKQDELPPAGPFWSLTLYGSDQDTCKKLSQDDKRISNASCKKGSLRIFGVMPPLGRKRGLTINGTKTYAKDSA